MGFAWNCRRNIMNKKKYEVEIIGLSSDVEEEIKIRLNDFSINCFCNKLSERPIIGSKWFVYLEAIIFDEINIEEISNGIEGFSPVNNSFSYFLCGVYNADKQSVNVGFDIDLSDADLYDFAFLDGKNVKILISRFDIELIDKIL